MGKVSIVIINYNGCRYLKECLVSIKEKVKIDYEIIVIDNHSSDGSADLLKKDFSWVKLIVLDRNYGHSYACNVAFREAEKDYVLLMDSDTVVTEKWLEPLIRKMEEDPGRGICISRAIFYPEKKMIHSDGGWAHYVGSMVLKNGFSELKSAGGCSEEIGAAGTTSMLVDKAKALEIGGFDDDFFVYLNDFEFSLRMRLAGYKCHSVPESIIYHKGGNPAVSYRGEGRYPRLRAFYIFRNRWYLIFKLYSLKTILLCLPALLAYECSIFVMALMKGLVLTYFKALFSFFAMLPEILEKRSHIKKIRCIKDKKLFSALPLTFVPGSVKEGGQKSLLQTLDTFLICYWNIIKRII